MLGYNEWKKLLQGSGIASLETLAENYYLKILSDFENSSLIDKGGPKFPFLSSSSKLGYSERNMLDYCNEVVSHAKKH